MQHRAFSTQSPAPSAPSFPVWKEDWTGLAIFLLWGLLFYLCQIEMVIFFKLYFHCYYRPQMQFSGRKKPPKTKTKKTSPPLTATRHPSFSLDRMGRGYKWPCILSFFRTCPTKQTSAILTTLGVRSSCFCAAPLASRHLSLCSCVAPVWLTLEPNPSSITCRLDIFQPHSFHLSVTYFSLCPHQSTSDSSWALL